METFNAQRHMEDHLISVARDPNRPEKERKRAKYKLKYFLGLDDDRQAMDVGEPPAEVYNRGY